MKDGVNLFTANGFENTAANNGSLIFAGASEISGKVGSNNTIGDIRINGANKIVKFNDMVNSKGNIINSNDATVQYGGDVNATNIKATVIGGVGAGKGTVEFINTKAGIKVDAVLSNTN